MISLIILGNKQNNKTVVNGNGNGNVFLDLTEEKGKKLGCIRGPLTLLHGFVLEFRFDAPASNLLKRSLSSRQLHILLYYSF